MPVDIILLDLMFAHGITGYDIFDEIRKVDDFADIPIIAVSASDTSFAVPKVRAKGFSGFIAKPIDFDRFPCQIDQVLNDEQVWYTG